MRRVYLDNGATAFPKAPGVGEAMADYIGRIGCNVGRGSYPGACAAGRTVLSVRERLNALVGGPGARNVVFTGGATHGLNLLLKGLLRPGDRAVTSAMEHNAVLRPLNQLEAAGVRVDRLPCNGQGELLLEQAEEMLTQDTRCVILTLSLIHI